MYSSNKRKDITPKKKELEPRKRTELPCSAVIVDLTLVDDDDANDKMFLEKQNQPNATRRLFKIEPEVLKEECTSHESLSSSNGSTNSEFDSSCSLPPLSLYRNDPKLPIYSQRNPNLDEIFQICLKNNVPSDRYVSHKPVRVKDTATFVVNQTRANVKNPKDLDADDTPGAYSKKEQTRFYQVEENDDGEMEISCEVHVTKNAKGNVVSGTYRERVGNEWRSRCADIEKVYAVIRKRAVHKATLKRYKTAFTRYIVWVMPLKEYNEVYSKLKKSKHYKLLLPNILMYYYFNTGKRVPIVSSKHGNAKDGASDFRPKEHSLKETCKELVQDDNRAARLICQNMQHHENILETFSDSSVVRNPKQVSNYRQNYGPSKKAQNVDDIRDVIFDLLEQSNEDNPTVYVLDKDQPFIQELLVRHGKQVGIVAFLKQTLKDVERFCTTKANPRETSPLCADTTFNISEYLVTQTTYQQLSVIRRDNLKHPWFPGPIVFHRDQKQEDFAYFWQAVKRGNPSLSNLLVLGTDEDRALSGGILQETEGRTIHLLGKEHVFENVEKKLVALNFPIQQRRVIMQDIFGGRHDREDRDCLYGCESAEEYDQKVANLKQKWNNLEQEHTKNNPSNKFVSYFTTHKEKQIREKMIKAVRRKANIDGDYGQNPIEWLNFLSKKEIDEFGKNQGQNHRDTSLTTALAALKNRYLRLYDNLVKAIHDEGPYMLSPSYSHLIMTYDRWIDMEKDEKSEHIKALMTYVPTTATPTTALPRSATTVTLTEVETAADDLPHSDAVVRASQESTAHTTPRRLIITAREANIQVEAVPFANLQDIFTKAEFLLNEPGAIMKAASNEDRMRTVKSRYGTVPLIVKPQTKNKNLFECNCKVFKGMGLCADTVAVAEDNGVLIEYVNALRKKFQRKKRVPNLTAAIESNLNIANRGHKQNEVQKKARHQAAKTRQESLSASLPIHVNERHHQFPIHASRLPLMVGSGSVQNTQNISTTPTNVQLPMEKAYGTPVVGNVTRMNSVQNVNAVSTNQVQSSLPVKTVHGPPPVGNVTRMNAMQNVNAVSINQVQSLLPVGTVNNPPLVGNMTDMNSLQNVNAVSINQGQSSLPVGLAHCPPPVVNARQDINANSINRPPSNSECQPSHWHSGMSPGRYELVPLPGNVAKCYGCGQNFAEKYRSSPYNIIVKHVDRRIRGRDASGNIVYNQDFTNTYYHLSKDHILKKNPAFDGYVFATQALWNSLTNSHWLMLCSAGLIVYVL